MKRIFVIAIVTLSASTVLAANGAKRAAHVNNRQDRQAARINGGIQNGSLTAQEQKRLAQQQNHVMRVEKRAAKDGTITQREARHLQREQNRASRNIYRKKHN